MSHSVKHIYKLAKYCIGGALAIGIINIFTEASTMAATNTAVNASVSVVSSCSMTATTNTTHSATLINGQESTAVSAYESGIGKTTISTSCNDSGGFSIYTVGYTGSAIGTTNSNKLVGANTGFTIPTGTGTSASNWSMKVNTAPGLAGSLAATIDNGFAEYREVPLEYTRAAHLESATYAGAPTLITTTYRAYISPMQAADNYSGKVRYVLVHPSSAVASTTFESAFAAAGKNQVQVNGNYYYAMQDMTTDICNGVVDYGTETQLIDIRDEKLYWVLKAAGGKCWMTQNLDLDLEKTPTNVATLTSLNTDLNVYDDDIYNNTLGYTYNESTGLITWTPSSSTYKNNATHSNGTASGSITNSNNYNNPRSWNLTVNGKDVYQKDGSTFASATCNYFTNVACLGSDKNFNTEPFAANGEHGKIGNYYNWSAAVASNNTSSRTANTYNAISGNPKNSICPKGWRLTRSAPAASGYNDFQNLYTAYGSSNAKANGSPLWLVRAGVVSDGSLYNSGNYGNYWSSTVGSSSYAYYLRVYSSEFGPSYDNRSTRGYGFSVRCVAR